MHTVLYSFTGSADGGEPYKGVTLGPDGNLYGTAVTGGSGSCEGGCGVTYKLTKNGDTWTQTVIHAFTGGEDGSGPGARVTVDNRGNVYGMTPTGGANGLGTIYALHPKANGSYALRVLHAFTGGSDGSSGSAGRMVIRNGGLYGAATTGGDNGAGMIFELKPTAGAGQWTFRTLYSFLGGPDGSFPYGALLFDNAGHISGTTYYGGVNGLGSVYQLTRQGPGSGRSRSFTVSKLVRMGIARSAISSPIAQGVFTGRRAKAVWEAARSSNSSRTKAEIGVKVLPHRFSGPPDGAFPYAGMAGAGTGTFTARRCMVGRTGEGAIYKFTP